MEPHEIKAEVVRNRSGLTIIANSLSPKVSPQAVDRVIRNLSVSERIRARVAQVIKMDVDIIWPEAA